MISPAPLQASKWLSFGLLIDEKEMESLIHHLDPFEIYQTGAVTLRNEGKISHSFFLESYKRYILTLKNGKFPEAAEFQSVFSTVFTRTSEVLFSLPIGEDRQLLRLSQPAIQLQPHFLNYSPYDHKFRAMVFGLDTITWGIQFSYPQIFQDPLTKEVISVARNVKFPNSVLFSTLQSWIRKNTIPTPFKVEGKVINVPMRLGITCLEWINCHPQLKEKNIAVYEN